MKALSEGDKMSNLKKQQKKVNRKKITKFNMSKKFAQKMGALKESFYDALGDDVTCDEEKENANDKKKGKEKIRKDGNISPEWHNLSEDAHSSEAQGVTKIRGREKIKMYSGMKKEKEESYRSKKYNIPSSPSPSPSSSHVSTRYGKNGRIISKRYSCKDWKKRKVKRIQGKAIRKERRIYYRYIKYMFLIRGNHISEFVQKNGKNRFFHYLNELKRIYYCKEHAVDTYKMMMNDIDNNLNEYMEMTKVENSQTKCETKKCHTSKDDDLAYFIQKQYLCSSILELFHNLGREVILLTHLMKPRPHEIIKRKKLLNEVEIFLKGIYPEFYLLIFGSCNTDLDMYNSDMDICIYNSIENNRTNVHKLYNEMKNNKLFKKAIIKEIINAKVPIIKCFFTEMQISIDFSFNQVSAIVSTIKTQNYIKENALIKYVIIFFKILLTEYNLNDASQGGISSFKLFLIIIKFMEENEFVFFKKNIYLYIGEVIHKFISYFSLFKDKSEEKMYSFLSIMYSYDTSLVYARSSSAMMDDMSTTLLQSKQKLRKKRNFPKLNKLFSDIFCKLNIINPNINDRKGALAFEKIFLVRHCLKKALYALSEFLISLVKKNNVHISPQYNSHIFEDTLSISAFFHFMRQENFNTFLNKYYFLFYRNMSSLCSPIISTEEKCIRIQSEITHLEKKNHENDSKVYSPFGINQMETTPEGCRDEYGSCTNGYNSNGLSDSNGLNDSNGLSDSNCVKKIGHDSPSMGEKESSFKKTVDNIRTDVFHPSLRNHKLDTINEQKEMNTSYVVNPRENTSIVDSNANDIFKEYHYDQSESSKIKDQKNRNNIKKDDPLDEMKNCLKIGNSEFCDELISKENNTLSHDQMKCANVLKTFKKYFHNCIFKDVENEINNIYNSIENNTNNQNKIIWNIRSKLPIVNCILDVNKLLCNRFHYHQIFYIPMDDRSNHQLVSSDPHLDNRALNVLKTKMLSNLVRFKNYHPNDVMSLEIKNELFVHHRRFT